MMRAPERRHAAPAAGPRGLPRLLSGYRPEGPMSLDEHVGRYGPPPAPGTPAA